MQKGKALHTCLSTGVYLVAHIYNECLGKVVQECMNNFRR